MQVQGSDTNYKNIYQEPCKLVCCFLFSDEIRVSAGKTFVAYFSSLEGAYDAQLFRSHLEVLYSGLLVHMDDSDPAVQQLILGMTYDSCLIISLSNSLTFSLSLHGKKYYKMFYILKIKCTLK